MDYKTNFIKKLKEYRKEKNLTQDDLAELLGYSQKNIAKWEQGVAFPPIEVLIELAKRMEISIDELVGKNKSIFEECVEYIVSVENGLNDTDGVVYDVICDIGDSFVCSTMRNMLSFKQHLNLSQSAVKTIVIKRLIDCGHIIVDGKKWTVSKSFAIESFSKNEELYKESIIQLKRQIQKIENYSKKRELTPVEKDNLETSKRILERDREFLEEIIKAKEKYLLNL